MKMLGNKRLIGYRRTDITAPDGAWFQHNGLGGQVFIRNGIQQVPDTVQAGVLLDM